MSKLFGTDGIRGKVNEDLTPEFAFKLGQAVTTILQEDVTNPVILIGNDTRRSADMFESALMSGITSIGGNAVSVGKIPTPGISYLIKKYGIDAGIMISASHNPAEYNGFKVFGNDGLKLCDLREEKIENIINGKQKVIKTKYNHVGTSICNNSGLKDYTDYIKGTVSSLSRFKVLVDCANGAASKTAEMIFSSFNLDVTYINNQPNGLNINENSGSTCVDLLSDIVIKGSYDIGISFDGDADRVLFVDEKGNIVDGDYILAILAKDKMLNNDFDINTVVGTVMTNLGLYKYFEKINVNIVSTAVGDRYVLEEMLKNNYGLGGEQSGHVILRKYQTTGDGQLTALHILRKMTENKKSLSELCSVMEKFPQKLLNIKVENEKKELLMKDEEILKYVKKWENKLKNNGRVLIRPSGTEPLIRVMVEAENEKDICESINEFEMVFKKRLKEI